MQAATLDKPRHVVLAHGAVCGISRGGEKEVLGGSLLQPWRCRDGRGEPPGLIGAEIAGCLLPWLGSKGGR